MKNPFLIGERLYLRPLEESDISTCLRWINDPEVTRTLGMYRPMNEPREREWLESRYKDDKEIGLAIVLKENDKHIGNIGLHGLDWKNREAELGIMIGEKDQWDKGYGHEAIELMLGYGFDRLGLHRIYLRVYENNLWAQRCYEKAGFRREGVMRESVFSEGRYWDTILMSLLEREWRELRSKSGKGELV
ncbi:MAG: GNAT family N-acetyltransferase [Candidatus Acetothermia bacterium]|jgi:RimJ/RimL family protein N-acetyltransferase|nr:GNAT family N-acetyltransferase [Candidatus Acetothermia bacterium]MDH7505772.1 GNAT family protein [Candidatus Acetothermia bacterium]